MTTRMLAGILVLGGCVVGCQPKQPQASSRETQTNPAVMDVSGPSPQSPAWSPSASVAGDEPADAMPSQPAALRTYTIQPGDTLYSIARTQLGHGNRWQSIVDANPGLDPQRLPIGRTIRLP